MTTPQIFDFTIRLSLKDFEKHYDTLVGIDDTFSENSMIVFSDEPGGYAEYAEGSFIMEMLQENASALDDDIVLKKWEHLTFDEQYEVLRFAANSNGFLLEGDFHEVDDDVLMQHINETNLISVTGN